MGVDKASEGRASEPSGQALREKASSSRRFPGIAGTRAVKSSEGRWAQEEELAGSGGGALQLRV